MVVRVRLAEGRVVHLVVGQRRRRRRRPARRASRRRGPRAGAIGPSSWATSTIVAPRVLEAAERAASACWLGRSTPGRRLVEEEQLRLAGERAGDQHPLLLAAGQSEVTPVATPVGQADHLEGVVDGGPVGARERPEPAAAGQPAGGDDLPDRGRARRRPRWRAAARSRSATTRRKSLSGVPKSATDPEASGSRPVSARTSVDLPEPLAPIRATSSPARTVRSMPRRIGRPAMATDSRRRVDGVQARCWHPFASWRAARFSRISER